MYLGVTGRKFKWRLSDHKRGDGNRTTNCLYAKHFVEETHKFVNPLENYETLKVVNNTVTRRHLIGEEGNTRHKYKTLPVYTKTETYFRAVDHRHKMCIRDRHKVMPSLVEIGPVV